MRRPLIVSLLVLSLAVLALPHRIAAAASARPPHAAAVQARQAAKKNKATRPQKAKVAKPKPDKKKNDRGFEL